MRYRIKVRVTAHVEVEVEAPDSRAAEDAGVMAALGVKTLPFRGTAESVVQLGEPWAACYGWADPPDDVIVVTRALGNVFDARDIILLRKRLQDPFMGLVVLASWNGESCTSASFRCSGRKGTKPMTAEQIAFLVAPR